MIPKKKSEGKFPSDAQAGKSVRHGSGLRASHMLHLGHAGHEAEAVQGGLGRYRGPMRQDGRPRTNPFARRSDPMGLARDRDDVAGTSNRLSPTCWDPEH